MRIIYNKHFPFGSFFATNIFGIIFCRSDKGRLSPVDKNHEYIHTLQQKEMLFVGFMLWYVTEWLYRYFKNILLKRKDIKKGNVRKSLGKMWIAAYYETYFEREAYAMEHNLSYASHRRPFEWWHMFVEKSSLLGEIGEFIGDIGNFIREDYRWKKYLFFLITVIAVIIGQVCFNIYDIIILPSYADGTSMLRIPMVYAFAYFWMLIPTLFMHNEQWRLRQWQVWVFPLLLVAIDGAGQGFDAYKQWTADMEIYFKEKFYLNLIGSYLFRSIGIIACLCLFRWMTTGKIGLYGLTRSTKYLRVYLLIFALLLPLFFIVSLTPQFLDFYPKMDISYYGGAFGWADWKTIGLFELLYANDYVAVESMFRGAMIVGMSRWLGARSVLPMVVTYMCIHLGKPDLELCSSVIGEYILGILAYRTKHLWGGIVIHLGIALLFEALGMMHTL